MTTIDSLPNYISVDPEISHGKPCFRINNQPTRLMVYIVLELLEGGATFDQIIEEYPQLTHNHIRAALHYAVEVAKNSEYIPFPKAK